MMKIHLPVLLLFSVFLPSGLLDAQKLTPLTPVTGEALPEWAIKMYGNHPNVWEIDDAYRIWRRTNPDVKTTYSQYYKKWRRGIDPYINSQGFEQKPTEAEQTEFQNRLANLKKNFQVGQRNLGEWSVIGPAETFNTNTGPSPLAKSSQVNVYCFDQSRSSPDVLYCGTEGGEVYKSFDRGGSWYCVSRSLDIGAPGAIKVHPHNGDIVFMGENNNLWRSMDGGVNWEKVMSDDNMYVNDIKINTVAPEIMLIATQNGLYRSVNAGTDWERLLEFPCYDLEWKPYDPSTVYLVRNDPAAGICRFYKSTDYGETWESKENGWFFSDQPGRNDGGARIAVTLADPERVYAVLIGEAKTGDDGFIGIYRSNDAGETWTLPNGPPGGPYDDNLHPNMATIGRTGGYHQGFYNLGLDVSDSNPDAVLAGFLSLWYTTDGAATWTCFGGYCGNPFNYVHPDCQEIEINGDDVWMTSDGGIEYSNDFFQTHYARNRGITGSDYWGFGAGWNEDILVGGRYHNGNSGQHENWMPGESLSLGGGEAATGYVNPGEGRRTYFSDIGGVILPESQNGYAQYFNLGKYPNESYYDAESGEMEWDPRSWNTFYVTNENKIWKTENGGASWNILHEFGTDPLARAMSFEVSRSNPDVMYLFQRDEYSWDPGLLWKTTDGGQSWNPLSFPPGYARRCVLAMSAEDEQRVWLAYADGGDGEKIYTSHDGGVNWENLTTPALNGEHITYILHQGGTDGGLYLGTFRTIWYRDDHMSEWMPYDEGLPEKISTCILRPFYRDHKIRIGAYGKSIWEAPFAVESRPVAQPMVNKHLTSCPGDTIRFDDFSMLSHEGATWEWQFPGGTPSVSNLRNPNVIYHGAGSFDVTLTVTNPHGTSTKTIEGMVEVLDPIVNELPPHIDFNTTDHFTISNPDGGITWSPVELAECDPDGNIAYYVDNYNYSSYGQDEIVLPLNIDLTQVENPTLSFHVAYAPYFDGNAFIDSLHVLISKNCGTTFETIFRSGGEALSTTTSGSGPNNLYEYEVFRPQNCEEWRAVELDLSAYAGLYVTLKFLNKSGYGNQMYIDDIVMEATLVSTNGVEKPVAISIRPNPTSGSITISHDELLSGKIQIRNATGELMMEELVPSVGLSNSHLIHLEKMPAGLYVVNLITANGTTSIQKLIKL